MDLCKPATVNVYFLFERLFLTVMKNKLHVSKAVSQAMIIDFLNVKTEHWDRSSHDPNGKLCV
jgi:hypothetical protein